MSIGTWGWLVLAFPLVGCIVCSLLYRSVPSKITGLIGSADAEDQCGHREVPPDVHRMAVTTRR